MAGAVGRRAVGEHARRPRARDRGAGPLSRLARRRSLALQPRRARDASPLPPPRRLAVPPGLPRSRTCRRRTRRTVRGDQSPLHHRRDPGTDRGAGRGRAHHPHGDLRNGGCPPRPRCSCTTRHRGNSAWSPLSAPARRRCRRSPRTTSAASRRASFARCIRKSPRRASTLVPQERDHREGAMLSVPIIWSTPRGAAAPRRREPLGTARRPAVHGGRPEAHRGHRHPDRHRDPERPPRARVHCATATRPRDADGARSADEAAAGRRRTGARRRRGGAGRARRERRAATCTTSSAWGGGAWGFCSATCRDTGTRPRSSWRW